MLKIDRQNKIQEQLNSNGSVLISELSQQLSCSEETIRRDLKEMEQNHKLIRIHGGAYLPEKCTKGVPLQLRQIYFVKEKTLMSKHIIDSYIEENDFLLLDSSSTCLTLAQELILANINVTIVTNSLKICSLCNEASSNIKVICLGGTLVTRNSSFVGYRTTEALQSFVADKSFISCPSVDINYGLVDNNVNEGMVRSCMLKQSRKNFLIVDHTKFSETTNSIFADLNSIDVIVTDKKLSSDWEDKCSSLNIKLDYI